MGSVGIAVTILGGLVAVIAGLGRQDWVAMGLGIGLIGLAFAVGDGLFGVPMWGTPVDDTPAPARDEAPEPTGDDESS